MIENYDAETWKHSERVAELTEQFARFIGESDNQTIEKLKTGALLHDIGKIKIPSAIINKPGALGKEEYELVKEHPKLGLEMLNSANIEQSEKNPGAIAEIIYSHHEKWDGSGYPDGLQGEKIPLSARIFSILDIWDAITNDRPYRKSLSPKEAVKEIQSLERTNLDPQLVRKFISFIEERVIV